ncbi:Ku protein [Paraburkholderia sp. UCT31]|uniref:non-homologous end joining protein Ku n=1 Tax=Paraburkholderia sp. UCT31 TaxID=2615209 RepID=UPI001655918D|nr:Ku protein [Paraburkholderia sp. UCT31]MBC8739814.1 Ku protein [Paraburkholderia sp. UCT31]
MPARSIASLSLSFGLVSIPVKLYSATESASGVKFNFLCADGSRAKQQYVSEKTGQKVERADLKKGYEFDKDRFVVFTPDELKALEEGASHIVEILAFVPDNAIDPIYLDKAYFIAPDKRGGKPYTLLQQALLQSHRGAVAKWAARGKTNMVQIRATEDGLVFQQLLYADEVRSLKDLNIEHAPVTEAELKLALQIIEQAAEPNYDPAQYEDEEKKRILKAIDQKIAGKEIVSPAPADATVGGQVIDLMEALRASLSRGPKGKGKAASEQPEAASDVEALGTKAKRPVRRTAKTQEVQETPAKVRGRK